MKKGIFKMLMAVLFVCVGFQAQAQRTIKINGDIRLKKFDTNEVGKVYLVIDKQTGIIDTVTIPTGVGGASFWKAYTGGGIETDSIVVHSDGVLITKSGDAATVLAPLAGGAPVKGYASFQDTITGDFSHAKIEFKGDGTLLGMASKTWWKSVGAPSGFIGDYLWWKMSKDAVEGNMFDITVATRGALQATVGIYAFNEQGNAITKIGVGNDTINTTWQVTNDGLDFISQDAGGTTNWYTFPKEQGTEGQVLALDSDNKTFGFIDRDIELGSMGFAHGIATYKIDTISLTSGGDFELIRFDTTNGGALMVFSDTISGDLIASDSGAVHANTRDGKYSVYTSITVTTNKDSVEFTLYPSYHNGLNWTGHEAAGEDLYVKVKNERKSISTTYIYRHNSGEGARPMGMRIWTNKGKDFDVYIHRAKLIIQELK